MSDKFRVAFEGGEDESFDTLNDALRSAMKDKSYDIWLHADTCDKDIRKLAPSCPCRPVRVQKGEA